MLVDNDRLTAAIPRAALEIPLSLFADRHLGPGSKDHDRLHYQAIWLANIEIHFLHGRSGISKKFGRNVEAGEDSQSLSFCSGLMVSLTSYLSRGRSKACYGTVPLFYRYSMSVHAADPMSFDFLRVFSLLARSEVLGPVLRLDGYKHPLPY